jgi:hypothetical protein
MRERTTMHTAGSSDAFACGVAARWMPRVLAGAVLASAFLATQRMDLEGVHSLSRAMRILVVMAGALLALAITRGGAEVRGIFSLGPDALTLAWGKRRMEVRYRDLAALEYDPPLSRRPFWLPAAALVDRNERRYRIPALVWGGERLIDELVRRSERPELAAWNEVRRIAPRMARPGLWTYAGYVLAAALLAGGVALAIR